MKNINKDSLIGLVNYLKYTPRTAPEFGYIFDRWVRDITLRNQTFKLTDLAKQVLVDYGLYESDEINMSKMRSLNKKLKSLGYKSTKSPLMLEHWNPIKNMKKELLDMENPTIDKVNDYFINQTDCFFKLTEKEWDLQPQKL
jgi:hypothetical protein